MITGVVIGIVATVLVAVAFALGYALGEQDGSHIWYGLKANPRQVRALDKIMMEEMNSEREYKSGRRIGQDKGTTKELGEVEEQQSSGEDLDGTRGQKMAADSGSAGGDDDVKIHGRSNLADASSNGEGGLTEHQGSYGETSNYRPLSAYTSDSETLHARLERLRKEVI